MAGSDAFWQYEPDDEAGARRVQAFRAQVATLPNPVTDIYKAVGEHATAMGEWAKVSAEPAPPLYTSHLPALEAQHAALAEWNTVARQPAPPLYTSHLPDLAALYEQQGQQAPDTTSEMRQVLAAAPSPAMPAAASPPPQALPRPAYTPPAPAPEPEPSIRSADLSPRPAAAPVPAGTAFGEPSPPDPLEGLARFREWQRANEAPTEQEIQEAQRDPLVQRGLMTAEAAARNTKQAMLVAMGAEAAGPGVEAGAARLRKGLDTFGLPEAVGQGVRGVGTSLARVGEGAVVPGAGVIRPEVARTLPGEVRVPDTTQLSGLPDIQIRPDGIEVALSRFQRPDAAGQETLRGGVFYSGQTRGAAGYQGTSGAGPGGGVAITGSTLFRRPLVLTKDALVGVGGLDRVLGEEAASLLRARLLAAKTPEAFAALVRPYLSEADAFAQELFRHFQAPAGYAQDFSHERMWAAADRIATDAARRDGYDGIITVLRPSSAHPPRIGEVVDLREATYPTPEGGYTLRPEFQPQAGAPSASSPIIPGAGTIGQDTTRFYHGTGTTFARPDAGTFDPNGLYGPGYYLTDEPRVASSYAQQRGGPITDLEDAQSALSRYQADLARATTAAERTDASAAIARAERFIEGLSAKGAQIRPVDVPQGLRLLDVDAPASVEEAVRIADALPPGSRSRQLFETFVFANDERSAVNPGQTGADLYKELRRATFSGGASEPAKVLQAVGFDGIKYAGGLRSPLPDAAGNPIQHTALVIFPESLPKLTNALSGQPGGMNLGNVLGAAGTREGVGALAGGLAGHAADVADPNRPDPLTDPLGANRNLMGGALAGSLAAGATRGLRPAAVLSAVEREGLPGAGMVRRTASDMVGGTVPEKALARLASTDLPPGSVETGLTAAEEAARLRLDKFPENVRPFIQDAAESMGFAQGQRRGVVPDAAAAEAGQELASATTTEQWLRGSKAGKAYNDTELRALATAVNSAAQRVADVTAEHATALAAGTATDTQLANVLNEGAKLQALTAIREGARAEAGRALRSFSIDTRAGETPADAIARIFKQVGGRDKALEAASEYQTLVANGATTQQMAHFWAGVELPPVNAVDWFRTLRYNSMLSGPRTFETNIVSNLLEVPWRLGRDTLASTARGRPGEMGPELAGTWSGMQRGAEAFMQSLTHGLTDAQAAAGDLPQGISARLRNPVARGVATVLEWPGRLLGASDEFAVQTGYGMVLGRRAAQEASAEGLTGAAWRARAAELFDAPTPAMMKDALSAAERMAYHGQMGWFGSHLERSFRPEAGAPAAAQIAANIIMPFMRTTYHITARGFDRSPLGWMGTAAELTSKEGRDYLFRGGIKKGVAPIGERLGDNVIGGLIGVAFINQALKGNVSGAGPSNPAERQVMQAQGWQSYSVRVGGRWVSYANWGPAAMTLAEAAAVAEALQYRKTDAGAGALVGDMLARTVGVVQDQTYLSSIGTVWKAMAEAQSGGERFMAGVSKLGANTAGSLIPFGSAINTVAQALDPFQRKPATGDLPGAVAVRVPGLRQGQPIARDVFGNQVRNQYAGGMAALPARVAAEVNPATATLRRYDGSRSAEMDTRIAAAITAVDQWRGNRRESPEPTAAETDLWREFHNRENREYARLRLAAAADQRRAAVVAGRR